MAEGFAGDAGGVQPPDLASGQEVPQSGVTVSEVQHGGDPVEGSWNADSK